MKMVEKSHGGVCERRAAGRQGEGQNLYLQTELVEMTWDTPSRERLTSTPGTTLEPVPVRPSCSNCSTFSLSRIVTCYLEEFVPDCICSPSMLGQSLATRAGQVMRMK